MHWHSRLCQAEMRLRVQYIRTLPRSCIHLVTSMMQHDESSRKDAPEDICADARGVIERVVGEGVRASRFETGRSMPAKILRMNELSEHGEQQRTVSGRYEGLRRAHAHVLVHTHELCVEWVLYS
eukprot:211356-Pleurochrysis_carterae.AAC.4